jgi:hypothetical protein
MDIYDLLTMQEEAVYDANSIFRACEIAIEINDEKLFWHLSTVMCEKLEILKNTNRNLFEIHKVPQS